MSSKGKGIIRSLFTPNISCGCRNPKLTDIINPRPKPKVSSAYQNRNQMMLVNPLSSSSGSWDRNGSTSRDKGDEVGKEDCTSTTFSLTSVASSSEGSGTHNNTITGCKTVSSNSVLGDSIAVEKHSINPYDDFQQSILQMIVQKQLYSKSDLQELLSCFLQLNSPLHHQTIIKAFTDLLNNASTCNINSTHHRSRYMSMKELKDSSCKS